MIKKKIVKLLGTVSGIIALSCCAGSPLYASIKYIASGYYNNYPYEYLNNEGKPSGFVVELFTVIAEKAGINSELLLLPPERMARIIEKGETDIIVGGVDSTIYEEYIFAGTALEIPFSFVARKDSFISDFRDLKRSRVVVAGHEIFSIPVSDIIRNNFYAETLNINNPDTAMMLLSSKGCDAVCIRESGLKSLMPNYLKDNIHVLEVNPGRFRYGFFVRKENEYLVNKIRSALSEVHVSGDYGSIYAKWFNKNDYKGFFNKYFFQIWFFVAAAVFILFLYINSLILKKRINDKTENILKTIDTLKKAEAELQKNEKKYRNIFNKSPSGLLILDSSGRIIHYNEAVEKIFGIIDPDELINLDITESPNATEWFKVRLKKYRSVSIEFRYDFELIKSNGFYKTSRDGAIIIDLSIFPFIIHTEEVAPGYICHIADVTQSRTLLRLKNETARRYEVIFDSVRDGLWEWNLADDSISINRQFVNLLGYRKEHLPETFSGICNLIHPDDREDLCRIIHEKISVGRSFAVEFRIRKNDGSWLKLKSRGDVVQWDHELKPVTVIATHTDMTRLMQIEKTDMDNLYMEKKNSENFNGFNRSESFDGRKALIVDDNCLITLHLSDLLTRMGFQCVNAMSGFEAIEIVKKDSEFDVVLLDLEMPELDGMTTMKILKDIKNDISVIANTGHCDFNCTDDLICSGFDDVINKPVHELVLMEKIGKLFASSKQVSQS